LSLKIVPPKMWKAQYWYWVGPSTGTKPSRFWEVLNYYKIQINNHPRKYIKKNLLGLYMGERK